MNKPALPIYSERVDVISSTLAQGQMQDNLQRFRQFYLLYPNYATASHDLSWSHLKISNDTEHRFYTQQGTRRPVKTLSRTVRGKYLQEFSYV